MRVICRATLVFDCAQKGARDALIVTHWDDLNRLAASLKDGLVRPSLVVSKLQAMQRQNPLQQAIQERGAYRQNVAYSLVY